MVSDASAINVLIKASIITVFNIGKLIFDYL